MSDEIELTNFIAGMLGAIMENKPLDDALKEVGLSLDGVLDKLVAPQSSAAAREYALVLLQHEYSALERPEGSDLYLVKKLLCTPDDYEEISGAVSGNDTDKFKVLKMVGSNAQLMGYKGENAGLEAYLVSAPTPLDAFRKTSTSKPLFYVYVSWFDAEAAKNYDGAITKAIYEHSPEAVQEAIDSLL